MIIRNLKVLKSILKELEEADIIKDFYFDRGNGSVEISITIYLDENGEGNDFVEIFVAQYIEELIGKIENKKDMQNMHFNHHSWQEIYELPHSYTRIFLVKDNKILNYKHDENGLVFDEITA